MNIVHRHSLIPIATQWQWQTACARQHLGSDLGHWRLKFGVSLDAGCWNLELSLPPRLLLCYGSPMKEMPASCTATVPIVLTMQRFFRAYLTRLNDLICLAAVTALLAGCSRVESQTTNYQAV